MPLPSSLLENYHSHQELWVDILATHIANGGEKYAYILDSEEFAHATILEQDFLKDLTITSIGVEYESILQEFTPIEKRSHGVFYTPVDVAHVMAKQYSQFPQTLTWLDPCCGVGILTWALTKEIPEEEQEEFLSNRVILQDIDPIALLTARVLLTLEYQDKKQLFHAISWRSGDFLESKLPKDCAIIMNPPYVSKYKDERFDTTGSDLYAIFMEKAIKESRGFIAITPQSFTHGQGFKELRALMLTRDASFQIASCDNVPDTIFRGRKIGVRNTNSANSVRAAITVWVPDSTRDYGLTGLLRWRSEERSLALQGLWEQITRSAPCSHEVFPKVPKGTLRIYQEAVKAPRLESLLSLTATEYALHVPTTPRYFITASYRPLQRSSVRTLYFHDEQSRERAYVVLNSGIAYWWWRVMDGGMSLSLATLKSTPLLGNLEREEYSQLTCELRGLEESCIVRKKNAGSIQENIKFPSELVDSLTVKLLEDSSSAEPINKTRRNSIID